MRPFLLHLDDALIGQPALLADARAAGATELDARDLGPELRLWARPAALDRLAARLDASPAGGPALTFFGSGDFHHVSALLIDRAIAAAGGDAITVVHVDNHPDWVRFADGLHCGSWAAKVARRADVRRVVTIGPASDDIRQPWRKGADLQLVRDGRIEVYPHGGARASHRVAGVTRPTVAGMGAEAFVDFVAAKVGRGPAYLTIDKDALGPADAATNWDQGALRLDFVTALIERLAASTRLVGADICGDWSRPAYAGPLPARLMKRAEAWLDQPRRAPDPAALAINEHANRTLLRWFAAA